SSDALDLDFAEHQAVVTGFGQLKYSRHGLDQNPARVSLPLQSLFCPKLRRPGSREFWRSDRYHPEMGFCLSASRSWSVGRRSYMHLVIIRRTDVVVLLLSARFLTIATNVVTPRRWVYPVHDYLTVDKYS